MEFNKNKIFDDLRIKEHVFHMESRGYDVFEDFLNEEVCDYLKDKFVINKKNHHQNRIATIEWNGNNIFTGSKDRLLKVLDARTGK